MNKRVVGAIYEEKAAAYLSEQGYLIRERNYHAGRYGEIDIIAQKAGTLVFVEVKYRKSAREGFPAEAVTFTKQRTICRVADYYMLRHGFGPQTMCRFDVICILGEEIEHLENAFSYIQR